MCGVVGFNHINSPEQVRTYRILKMMEQLVHRGPDQGAYVLPTKTSAIGHTRMKVRGSDRITQPFIARSLNSIKYCSVNGEIYNKEFSWTDTDSELCILSPEKLIGEFAFAIHDTLADTTTLTRDRFGVKPMYYTWSMSQFYAYASEPQALLAYEGFHNPDIDHDFVCRMFVNMLVPNKTIWKNIWAVPPGCTVTLSLDKAPVIKQYWDLPVNQEQRPLTTPIVAEIQDRLREAVRIRVHDTPVMCYVSGGMDGQIIHDLVNKVVGNKVPHPSITCDFGDDDYYKDPTTIKLDYPPIKNAYTEFGILNKMSALASRSLRTVYNPLGIAKMDMAKKSKELGYNAIISGQGADELFAGYQFFNHQPWSGLSSSGAWTISHANHTKSPDHYAWEDIYGFTPQFLHPWLRLWRASCFYHIRHQYDPFAEVAEMFKHMKHLDRLTLEQYIWIKTHFVDQILTWGGDRPEMMYSIEGRIPYLDLADIAFSIRPEDRKDKKPLRQAFAHLSVTQVPKKSFMYPYSVQSTKSNRYMIEELTGPIADVAFWQAQTLEDLCRAIKYGYR